MTGCAATPPLRRPARRRAWRAVAALLSLALLPLTACGDAAGPLARTAAAPIPAPDRLQADRVRVSHVVRFVPGSARAAPGELARLRAFLNAVGPRPVDRVALAATTSAAAARLGVVQEELAARGIAAVAAAPVAAGGDLAVISVERVVALPAACLVDGGQAAPDGGALPGLGCANALNLARMVADPADLLRGRPAGPADGTAAVLAIGRYRTGQITPLISETASGKVEQPTNQQPAPQAAPPPAPSGGSGSGSPSP